MIRVIRERITEVVNEWNLDLHSKSANKEIIALHFGIQMVDDRYEIYIFGHTWYDGQDLWLLDQQWSPKSSYISLGKESLKFNRLKILEESENVLKDELTNSKDLYQDFIVVVGEFERLK
jgi:hypothetical protein